ncbi:MAG TPA: argininosuccinate synthase [Bacillota bacterium]|nr:argininosuccinate synthase [Bacillota bacterium]
MSRGQRVVLSYSGGVDTTACIPYLKHEMGVSEVITVTADLGQNEDLKSIQSKALSAGANEALVLDVKEEFIKDFAFKALKANAVYEKQYPLMSALGRPLIAKLLVQVAEERQADCVAHGATGIGNDQVRFDLSVSLLNPDLKVLAPAREWNMTRSDSVRYIKEHGIQAHVQEEKPFAFDINILGCNMESGPLDDPWQEPPEEIFKMTRPMEKTPDTPDYVEIEFQKGLPVALNGKSLPVVDLFKQLNELGGKHCIGRVDMIENRVVGIKSREIYEIPGYSLLLQAHRDLESFILTSEVSRFKSTVETLYSELVYNGFWFGPLRKHLDVFIDDTQERISGVVKLKLFKGMALVTGRKSPNSLYEYELYKNKKSQGQNAALAEGFIHFWGLSTRTLSKKEKLNSSQTPKK